MLRRLDGLTLADGLSTKAPVNTMLTPDYRYGNVSTCASISIV
jgi:hypothetical protein